ncbi:MAG: di-trans,poly-cis-decaprenylcistransferase [Flavobacteriales bacterium]|nr:di-trans,poly-cis-decaprenylcistransferase [Flavobacteriales bacterium]
MDGNGRWAEQHGEPRISGHMNGVTGVREALTGASEIGVRWLTLYAFSTENWNRPQAEVSALLRSSVRLRAIGDVESLPENCRQTLEDAMARTAGNTRITLTLALSYSARWEITRMAQRMAADAKAGTLNPAAVDEQAVAERLATAGMPDPELLIRTSGEQRISNFLLWQIAYAELWFTPVLWPDFRKEHLFQAVLDYQGRERRFGKTSQQVTTR